jgi:NADH-quinone oxidoreductase subunit M
MPRLVAVFLLGTLSSIALPGMNGFVGEFLILLGGFLWKPKFAALAATGVILSAVYMLWMFQRVNYGEVTNEKNRALPDLTPREWALMVPTVATAILMGVFPTVFLRPMEPSVKKTVERVTGRSFAGRPAPATGDWRLAAGTAERPATADGRGQLPVGNSATSESPVSPAAGRQPRAASAGGAR